MDKSENMMTDIFKNLKLDDAFTQAILTTMTEETKEKMLEGIMSYLTSVEGDSYYNKKTVLQNLFEGAIRDPLRTTLHQVVANDTRITAKCREIASKAVDQFIQKDVNKMVDNMVQRMEYAFTRED